MGNSMNEESMIVTMKLGDLREMMKEVVEETLKENESMFRQETVTILYGAKEISEFLGMSKCSLWRLLKSGELDGVVTKCKYTRQLKASKEGLAEFLFKTKHEN